MNVESRSPFDPTCPGSSFPSLSWSVLTCASAHVFSLLLVREILLLIVIVVNRRDELAAALAPVAPSSRISSTCAPEDEHEQTCSSPPEKTMDGSLHTRWVDRLHPLSMQ